MGNLKAIDIDMVKDIQKNYRLPQEGRTIGEMIAEARQQTGQRI